MNSQILSIQQSAQNLLTGVEFGTREARIRKVAIGKLVIAAWDMFVNEPDREGAHKVAIDILGSMQQLTPGCTTPALLMRDDPWIKENPETFSPDDWTLVGAHRQSQSFENLKNTLTAIEALSFDNV